MGGTASQARVAEVYRPGRAVVGNSIFHLIAACDSLLLNFPEEREKVKNWIRYASEPETASWPVFAKRQAQYQLRKWYAEKSKELEVVGCG